MQGSDPVLANIGRALFDHERQGHAAIADSDDHRRVMLIDQEADLPAIVVGEQGRPRQGRPINSRIMQGTVCEPIVEIEIAGADLDPQERIAGVDRLAHMAIVAGREAVESSLHDRHTLIVDIGNPVDRVIRVVQDLNIADTHSRKNSLQLTAHPDLPNP